MSISRHSPNLDPLSRLGFPPCSTNSNQAILAIMTASSVDCAWLVDRLFATGSPHDLLLLDVRPIEKYAEGHVNGAINLTCSNLMLRRLKKGNLALSVLVNGDEAKAKFAARRKSHYVVLYDENSSSSELIDLIATKLRDESLNQIRILEGAPRASPRGNCSPFTL